MEDGEKSCDQVSSCSANPKKKRTTKSEPTEPRKRGHRVEWDEQENAWRAVFRRKQEDYLLGCFADVEDARSALAQAKDVGFPRRIPPKSSNRKKACTSRFRGVSWSYKNAVWRVNVQYKNQKISVGSYEYEEDAALAYNEKVISLKGMNVSLNDVDVSVRTRYPPAWVVENALVKALELPEEDVLLSQAEVFDPDNFFM